MSGSASVPESLLALLGRVDPRSRKHFEAILCADQRRRWSRGDRLPAEAYRTALPALDDELLLDLIYSEFVLREQLGEGGIVHRVAAVLDDDRLAGELLDVRERFGQDAGLGVRITSAGVVHYDVPVFSSM